jgi:hypothetical protein
MGEQDNRGDRWIYATRLALTGVATALAGAHLIWPRVRIDAITVALLVIAVLPWLHTLFTSITTPFFSVQYRELKQQVEAAASTAESARQLVVVNEERELGRRTLRASEADAALARLAQEYNDIRSSMRAGAARTDRMTTVVGRMAAAIEAGAAVDIEHNLHSRDRGERLAGYTALYVHPDPSKAAALVDCLLQLEDAPFGEYWALQSLRRIVEAGGRNAIDQDTHAKLLGQAGGRRWGRDRRYELDRILRLLDQGTLQPSGHGGSASAVAAVTDDS